MFSISTYEQVAAEPSTTAKGKLDDYFGSVWNKFDFVIYVTCLVTFVLKNFKETFWVRNLHEQTIDSLHSWLLHFKQLVVIVSQQNIGSISRIRSKQLDFMQLVVVVLQLIEWQVEQTFGCFTQIRIKHLFVAFYIVNCGCGKVCRGVAPDTINPWFESSNQQISFLVNLLKRRK